MHPFAFRLPLASPDNGKEGGLATVLAFVLAALACAVFIVGPGQALRRLLQWGGALIVLAAVVALLSYVVSLLLAFVLVAGGFALMVCLFVCLLGPSRPAHTGCGIRRIVLPGRRG